MYIVPVKACVSRNVISTIKYIAIGATLCMGLHTPGHAAVVTDFSGNSLDPNVHLDVPNSSMASVTLNSGNGSLDFRSFGNVDMWATRNNAPFAWTARPLVSMGDTWWVETKVTMPNTGVGRLAGLTFYGGPDGTGGANQGMDFHFAIDNWGSQPVVRLQGLGDNAPGNLGSNLTGVNLPISNPSVFLRTEITESGVSDFYKFMYKTNVNSAWTTLGSMNSSVDNARAAIFLKSYQASQASFDYLNVGSNATAVPEPESLFLSLIGLVSLFLARGHHKIIVQNRGGQL